ncbi:MAG: hypothetical protein AAB393_00125 [Bacteroidota bacterium]
MPKKIRIIIDATLELPDKAEVIRFKDEDGIVTDHIKFLGKLFRPDITWLQYHTSDLTKKKYPKSPIRGMGWEGVDDDTYNEYFCHVDEKWYLEEL